MNDLISREDAIKAVAIAALDDRDELEALEALPSAVCDDCIWHVCNYNKAVDELPSAETHEIHTETHGVCSDLISREAAIEALDEDVMGGLNYERILQSLPSAEANSDDIIIKGAKGIQDGLYNIKDGKLFKYKANGGTVRTYPIVPSAEAVQVDAISKRFISDAILQKISELNAQGEKAIPIAREFIRFKRFVDGITPIRAEAVQGWRTGKPTKGGKYIVTLIGIGGYKFVSIMHYDKPFMPNIEVSGACWYRDDDEWGDVVYDDNDILAWIPLPTPYKGGGSE